MTTRDDEADLMLTMPMKTGQKDERVGLLEAVSFPVLTGLPFLPHRFRNTKDRERGHPLGESILKEDPHASSRSTQGILLRRRSAANGADPPPKERLRDRRRWSRSPTKGAPAGPAPVEQPPSLRFHSGPGRRALGAPLHCPSAPESAASRRGPYPLGAPHYDGKESTRSLAASSARGGKSRPPPPVQSQAISNCAGRCANLCVPAPRAKKPPQRAPTPSASQTTNGQLG